MKRNIILGLALFIGFAAAPARADDKTNVAINPQDPRADIRAELLKYTPLGSSTHDVMKFLKTRLEHGDVGDPEVERHPATGPSAEASRKKGVKVIRINLADYLTNPIMLTLEIPLPLRSSLIAQWAFDKDDKLIEIFLDRMP